MNSPVTNCPHTDRPLHAKGMCRACYWRAKRRNNAPHPEGMRTTESASLTAEEGALVSLSAYFAVLKDVIQWRPEGTPPELYQLTDSAVSALARHFYDRYGASVWDVVLGMMRVRTEEQIRATNDNVDSVFTKMKYAMAASGFRSPVDCPFVEKAG